MKTILDKCNCPCHTTSNGLPTHRPDMAQIHGLVQTRQWNNIQRAIRDDASVAMRIDDSAEEDRWFGTAREAAWRRECHDVSHTVEKGDDVGCCRSDVHSKEVREEHQDAYSKRDELLPVRYWVSNRINGQSAIRQCRTLLHSISKLKFYSEEALITQLSHGDCEELHDLVDAMLTVKMIIDASCNDFRPLEEDCYNELLKDEIEIKADHITCRNCSCYYQSQYCPPVGLDPVEHYKESDDCQSSNRAPRKVLHKSVLTMTDALGATPLHLLTGEGSAHVDLVRVFLDGCRSMDDGTSESIRRPTVHDLLSAQNGHGCTPLHFLSDSTNEDALRLMLDRLQREYDCKFHGGENDSNTSSPNFTTKSALRHPLLIQDGDGDLPLHFACSNGANTTLLSTLTTLNGHPRAALVRNSEGRLPIDELICWYMDLLSNTAANQHESENGSESDEESESYDDHEDHDDGTDSSESTEGDTHQKEMVTRQHRCDFNPEEMVTQAMRSMLDVSFGQHPAVERRIASQFSLSQHCKYHLWDRMWTLIQAGANYITADAMDTHPSSATSTEWKPIHASVIVTKSFDFPAVALVASVLMARDNLATTATQNDLNTQQHTAMALLQEDYLGRLPLHLACGDVSYLLSSADAKFYDFCDVNVRQQAATTSACPETLRWDTHLQCSMMSYLLHLCPESARVPTREGRLPLHLFLVGGYNERHRNDTLNIWEDVKKLLKACPEALITPDVCSHLYPFQAAAASTTRKRRRESGSGTASDRLKSLEITYRLIMEDPSLCRTFDDSRPTSTLA